MHKYFRQRELRTFTKKNLATHTLLYNHDATWIFKDQVSCTLKKSSHFTLKKFAIVAGTSLYSMYIYGKRFNTYYTFYVISLWTQWNNTHKSGLTEPMADPEGGCI